ncbi:MAG: membrane protein insertion efficiency factor YidD [Lentisphaeria bacterium]|nr:membrane protein insertion efficiency factor YidD [Lentisphaeria bacterium]
MRHPDHPAPEHLRCKTAGSAGASAPDAEKSRTDPGKTDSGHFVRELVIFPVRLYQRWISPLLPPCCRFTPSCSQYMIEAVRVHGVLRGLMLGSWRILRCNPWCRGGYDPVPPKRSGKE